MIFRRLVCLAWLALLALPANASAAPQEAALAVPPDGPIPSAEQAEKLTHEISTGLRCPVCQGMSVGDSTSESARTMKGRIHELVEQGYTHQQIETYFIGSYGEWVLLEPPARGFNLVIWLGPGLVLGLGLAWSFAVVARWRRQPEPLPSDLGIVPKDKYEERLLSEIDS